MGALDWLGVRTGAGNGERRPRVAEANPRTPHVWPGRRPPHSARVTRAAPRARRVDQFGRSSPRQGKKEKGKLSNQPSKHGSSAACVPAAVARCDRHRRLPAPAGASRASGARRTPASRARASCAPSWQRTSTCKPAEVGACAEIPARAAAPGAARCPTRSAAASRGPRPHPAAHTQDPSYDGYACVWTACRRRVQCVQ